MTKTTTTWILRDEDDGIDVERLGRANLREYLHVGDLTRNQVRTLLRGGVVRLGGGAFPIYSIRAEQ